MVGYESEKHMAATAENIDSTGGKSFDALSKV